MSHLDVVVVGHRGTGKSTAARVVSGSDDIEFVDLDARIARAEGASCADLVARDEPRFRELEGEHMREVLASPPGAPIRIIAPGAGCEHLPERGALTVWLTRDGWERKAKYARRRLRPELDFDDEIAWMKRTREPRWAKAAHFRVDTPHLRAMERTAWELEALVRMTAAARTGELAPKTYSVPSGPWQVARAFADAELFGLAGVELRSDLTPRAAEHPDALAEPGRVLASLRTEDPAWLEGFPDAGAYDVDVAFLDALLAAGTLERLSPRRLLLSSHPGRADLQDLDALERARGALAARHPGWADHVVLKYAPQVETWAELEALMSRDELRRPSAGQITFLPQGDRFAWTRPWLAGRINRTNYAPVGLSAWRTGGVFGQPTPYDLQDWVGHMAGPAPQVFDGLLGDPVRRSVGDLWHRHAALERGEARSGYVKIPIPKETDDAGMDLALRVLGDAFEVRGLSVTAPHKRRLVARGAVRNPERLDAANTLRRDADGWVCTDTDEVGMRATLAALEARGVTPGDVAVIGRGGVSPAVTRAIRASQWRLVHHASAREGWGQDAPGEVTLVVNAAGDADNVYVGAPEKTAWVDLHYTGVRRAPGRPIHLIGDTFFEAQAHAQRAFWARQRASH
jgi:shikimate kinase